MSIVATPVRRAPRAAHTPARATVMVDCIDAPRRDLIVYWLLEAGYSVRKGAPDVRADPRGDRVAPRVLITDRFGADRAHGATIQQMKERRPDLRVIVVGAGGRDEPAQLSLASAAGADATLRADFDRESVVRLLRQWA